MFLSHNHEDKPFVRRLATDLSVFGASIWIDEVEMKVGDSLIERIGDGITGSDFVIAVLSKNSVQSAWVRQELEIAMTRQIGGAKLRVLPIRLDDATLPSFLIGKLYCDFSRPNDYRQSLRQIIHALDLPPLPDATNNPSTRARWYCGYCGWACHAAYNDYLCWACGAIRVMPIGTSTMVMCSECGTWNLAVVSHCDRCGGLLGYRRPPGASAVVADP